MPMCRSFVGVDVGGTFTDFVLLGDGAPVVVKRASTPGDPAVAVAAGLAELDPRGRRAVAHGTTVATNALLERRGARTAFIATRGFGDLLTLGRGNRSALYSLAPPARATLVPPELCFEADERVAADGSIVRELDDAEAVRLARMLETADAESIAICLLFSYLAPDHERRLGSGISQALRRSTHISLSVDVLGEFREYERASTTVVNAYVAPRVAGYLRRLERAAAPRRLSVMGSHGGMLTPAVASRLPVTTVLSGPAAGVQGALAVARRAGCPRILTLDMGGTSTDVALCDDAVPFAGAIAVCGIPIHRPAVDVHTVGAGGGSIASVDSGGALRVGPTSAGADPGPAAYARGGRAATVTDAHVVLGRLPADVPLGGVLRLDRRAAADAVAAIAARLDASVDDAALGILAVVNATMERALRRVSVERGFDPQEFSLAAFGGAGPLHGCALADAVAARDVLVPVAPGALSALGLATAVPVATASRTVVRPGGTTGVDIARVFAEIEHEARALLSGERVVRSARSADVRYAGQSWELTVPWPADDGVAAVFETAHERRYGYRLGGTPVEVVTLRVRVEGARHADLPPPPAIAPAAVRGTRVVLDDATAADVPLLDRRALPPGDAVDGPAVIVQSDATTFVAPGWIARVGAWGDLRLVRAGHADLPTPPCAAVS